MRLIKTICCACLLALSASCDFQVPNSNEGLVDTLVQEEVRLAKQDTPLLRIDTLPLPGPDGAQGSRAYDSVKLAPSQSVETGGVHPDALVRFSKSLIGVPYVYGSSDPKVGFDCSGFITYVFNHFGIRVPRSSVDFTHVGREVPVDQARSGDLILFTGTNHLERSVGHMGIVVSNTDTLRFIHSTSGKQMGVTITPLGSYYQQRYMKTIRVFP